MVNKLRAGLSVLGCRPWRDGYWQLTVGKVAAVSATVNCQQRQLAYFLRGCGAIMANDSGLGRPLFLAEGAAKCPEKECHPWSAS